ncbi:MAG: VWA domain-containing protein [Deltaproteobacteria bacterium]|nr:VWA domain-containing protein [Deltaproteobacteria bacterium]
MTFRFAYPVLLVLLVVVVGWVLIALRRKPATVTYSMASTVAQLSGSTRLLAGKIPLILRVGCLTLLVLASARPQFFNVSRQIRSPGVDIMLCLDTSGSMRALDFKLDNEPVSRLTAVKKVVADFIKKREMDRIGLVVFGEEAFTQAPLTLDKGLLLGLVEKMEVGMAGDRTTPEEAAEAVGALDVKIYTIGVGGKGPAPFKVKTFFGTRLVHQQVDLDEETLRTVAEVGGGKYFRAADSEKLSEIYDIIDRQEKTEIEVKEFFHFKELYCYLLVPALCLFLLEVLLKNTFLRVIP